MKVGDFLEGLDSRRPQHFIFLHFEGPPPPTRWVSRSGAPVEIMVNLSSLAHVYLCVCVSMLTSGTEGVKFLNCKNIIND